MSVNYHWIAGQSLDRLAALGDGIFAVAMTLLVLELRAPALAAAHVQQPIWGAAPWVWRRSSDAPSYRSGRGCSPTC